jgi:hypothetical protein
MMCTCCSNAQPNGLEQAVWSKKQRFTNPQREYSRTLVQSEAVQAQHSKHGATASTYLGEGEKSSIGCLRKNQDMLNFRADFARKIKNLKIASRVCANLGIGLCLAKTNHCAEQAFHRGK